MVLVVDYTYLGTYLGTYLVGTHPAIVLCITVDGGDDGGPARWGPLPKCGCKRAPALQAPLTELAPGNGRQMVVSTIVHEPIYQKPQISQHLTALGLAQGSASQ